MMTMKSCVRLQGLLYLLLLGWLLIQYSNSQIEELLNGISSLHGYVEAFPRPHHKEQDEVMAYASIGPLTNPGFVRPLCYRTMSTATKNLIRGRRPMNKERDVDFQEERSLTRLPSLSFKQDREMESLCSATFQPLDLSRLRRSLMEEFKYLTLFDEIPASSSLGKIEPREDGFVQYFLFTHLNFDVFYRDDRVVRVRASSEQTLDITEKMYGEHWEHWEHGTWSDLPLHVNFTFAIKWKSAGSSIYSHNMHRDCNLT